MWGLVSLGLIAQAAMFGFYFEPRSFIIDAFTTAVAHTAGMCVFYLLGYHALFGCVASVLRTRQKIIAVCMVTSFGLLTASRLSIPLFTLILNVVQRDVHEGGGGKVAQHQQQHSAVRIVVRLLFAILLIAATYAIQWDAVRTTPAGQFFRRTVIGDGAAMSFYFVVGIMFVVSYFAMNHVRTKDMHTADTLRWGCFGALPITAAVWAVSFSIPNTLTTRFGIVEYPEDMVAFAVITVCVIAIKLVVLACYVEAVKRGVQFDFVAFTSLASLSLVVAVLIMTHGTLSLTTTVALITIVLLIAGLVALRLFGARRVSGMEDEDMHCDLCEGCKTMCWGVCWHPASTRAGGCVHRLLARTDRTPPSTVVRHHLDEDEDGDEGGEGSPPARAMP